MAEKEERILIDVINPGINCVYRLDNDPKGQSLCKHNGNMEPVTAKECRHCDEGMTRQEAIDMIAKALCQSEGWPCKECRYGKDNASCQTCLEVELYKQYAEAALNALLEGEK